MTKNENQQFRTSKKQVDCYLSFVANHPEINLHKNDPTRPKRTDELWSQLAEELNALKGPTRSPTKWKESLSHWKNQVRSRARKQKAHRLVTNCNTSSNIQHFKLEQSTTQTFGSSVVECVENIPTLGVESKGVVVASGDGSDETNSQSFDEPPTTSRKRKATADEMYAKMMSVMEQRSESERAFQVASLKYFTSVAESISSVASALVSLAKAIERNNKK